MRSLKPLLYISLLILGSCQSIAFAKKEMAFAGKISSLLNGARVTIRSTATSSTSEGSFKKYAFEIEGLSLDGPNPDMVIMGAGSLPALCFYEDTIADPTSYKYIEVTVKAKGNVYESQYTPRQLRQVHESFLTVEGFINALKTYNSDSLSYYVDRTPMKDFSPDALINTMKQADAKYGTVQKEVARAFKFDDQEGRHVLYCRFTLHRGSVIQGAEIWVDPSTKKVVGYDL